jgi:hypothetical protein
MVDLTNNEESPQERLFNERLYELEQKLSEAQEALNTAKNELDAAINNGDADRIKFLELKVSVAEGEVSLAQDNIIMLEQAYDDGIAMGVVRPDPVSETTKSELTTEKKNLEAELVNIQDKINEIQNDLRAVSRPKNLQENAEAQKLQNKDTAMRLYLSQVENRIEDIRNLLLGKPEGSAKKSEVLNRKQTGTPMDYTFDLEYTYPGQLNEEQILQQFEDFKKTDIRPI